jgi:hypothetical protein
MSKKLTPEAVVKAAGQVGITKEKQQRLLEMLSDLMADDGAEAEKTPPVKKQFAFVLSDPTGRFTKEFLETSGLGALIGWVVQLPEEDSPYTVRARIVEAAHHFNTTKKGRLLPVQTIGEACENVPSRIFKEQSIWIKTKCAVYAIPCANEIGETPSILGDDRGTAK